jgi:oxazoline/thiazoline synthase
MAFGSHLDPRIAVTRALSEINQMSPAADEPVNMLDGMDDELESWLRTATLENQPYLAPDPDAAPWRIDDHPSQAGADLAEDVAICQARVEALGMKMHVLDQTRTDIGLPVVRVVVPGMRSFWRRLAPGRLYDVPVQLGWLERPLPEDELNPIAMFL